MLVSITQTSAKALPKICPAGCNLIRNLSETFIHCLYLQSIKRYLIKLVNFWISFLFLVNPIFNAYSNCSGTKYDVSIDGYIDPL